MSTDTATSTALATIDPPGNRHQLDTFDQAQRAWPLAERLAKSPEFVPKGMMNRPEAVLAVMLRGHELDVPPMVALAQMHVIEGRVGMAAELMRALVLRAGHEIWPEEITNTRVTMCGRRSGSGGDPVRITWTMDDAQKAGISRKGPWSAYPRAMLTARATTELVRLLFPDVVGGLRSIEELADLGDDDWVDVLTDQNGTGEPTAAPSTTTRKAAAPSARARKKAAPTPPAAPRTQPAPPPLPHELDQEQPTASPVAEPEHPAGDEPADDPDVVARAQKIAMRCNDLQLDRAEVIYAVTSGQKTSAKTLTADEALAVLEVLRQIKDGAKKLDSSGEEPQLVDVNPDDQVVDAELVDDWDATVGAEQTWDADTWRRYLAHAGVKVVAVIRQAQEFAASIGEDPPPNLAALHGRDQLCLMLRVWIEEQREAQP